MLLYISIYYKFIKRAITSRRLYRGMLKYPELALQKRCVIEVLARDILACLGNLPEAIARLMELNIVIKNQGIRVWSVSNIVCTEYIPKHWHR